MSKKREIHNTQEIEKLLEVARFMLDLCQLHGAKIPPSAFKAILNREAAKLNQQTKASCDHKSYSKLILESVPPTIPEVPETEVLGEDS